MEFAAGVTPAEAGGFVELSPETRTITEGGTIPMQPALKVGLLTRLLKQAEVGTDESLSAH